MLNKISQTQKDKYYMIQLIHGILKIRIQIDRNSEQKTIQLSGTWWGQGRKYGWVGGEL